MYLTHMGHILKYADDLCIYVNPVNILIVWPFLIRHALSELCSVNLGVALGDV